MTLCSDNKSLWFYFPFNTLSSQEEVTLLHSIGVPPNTRTSQSGCTMLCNKIVKVLKIIHILTTSIVTVILAIKFFKTMNVLHEPIKIELNFNPSVLHYNCVQ